MATETRRPTASIVSDVLTMYQGRADAVHEVLGRSYAQGKEP
jgi:hypothetical protein